ncbi:MAG: prephenate dehydrogenase/arogenate dehydrogenase family protein, partial [Burkholderiaceae bacterium]|nr:prephenate dehydrogenase/arogenate dehydrogenase family protein [Burkholderiaceae bacterium]
MSRNQFGTVAIVGVGLIGGSIGLALKKAGVVTEVIGVGRSA